MSDELPQRRSPVRIVLMFAAAGVLAVAALILGPRGQDVPPQPPQPQVNVQQERPRIQVVFALDTTGSMGGLIEGAKEKIWSIASEIARGQPTPILEVGLVAFRDDSDDYVTQVFDLTRDLDGIYVNLRGLDANGGGDTPEHVGKAMADAVSKVAWSQDPKVMKMIYVVGDAPPHQRDPLNDAETWAKRAHERGIAVNTIRCGDLSETEQSFTRLAQLGNGAYFSIAQSGGWVATATPYDEKLKELNREIATKTLYGGKKPAREGARRKAEAMGDMSATSAADRLSAFNRNASGGVATSAAPAATGGAVDYADAPEKVAEASAEELPEELAGLDKDARVARANQLATERKALEKQVIAIAKERDAWLSKNVVEKEDAFDSNVKKTVKEKAAAYGLKY